MAFHNANFASVPLSAGTYDISVMGDNVSASTVHQIFCLTDGSITISALGGGTFTWAAAKSGNKIDVLTAGCTVNSGTFVGFRTNPPHFAYRG